MPKQGLLNRRYRSDEIPLKRAEARRALEKHSPHLAGGRLDRVSQSDLRQLFLLYDRIFFHNYFRDHFLGQILFSLSPRMTRSAGKTIYPKNLKSLSPQEEHYELRFSEVILFNYDSLDREKKVNGIKTRDSLEALQAVLEHELCHLIELHCFKQSSCRGARFQALAFNLFGHTESVHQLPVASEIAAKKYGLSVGDWALFQVDGDQYRGVISRITRRATVMVPDAEGSYRDLEGRRYCKHYVPLELLRRTEPL